ncbi:MAG: SDR family oxidoreductase [Cyclobacteriaceae bacterium]|nr:SDR family oxidoreductase [Cyclobacteriaceae bacterium]
MVNQLAVITGASKGIGKALAFKLAQKGFNLALCSRNIKDLEVVKLDLVNKYKINVFIKQVNVSQKKEVENFVKDILELNDSIEILINNAGVFIPGEIHREEDGVMEEVMQTNLYSAYYLTRGLVHQMIENKRGHIFNMSSVAGLEAYPNGGSYCISKFALTGFSKVLREELKDKGIRVTTVYPGATLTSSWEGVDIPEERFMTAEDIAEAMYAAYSLSDRTVLEELILRPQLGDI